MQLDAVLSALEKEVVDVFVKVAAIVNLPRSVGELYGILFISPEPMCISLLMKKLNMSKGSTSQGLKILRSFGAVNTVYIPGDRRDFYEAEAQLKKIVGGFINEQLRPHFENGKERIQQMEQLAKQSGEEFFIERIDRLKGWHKKAAMLAPFAASFAKADG
ncbi:MAG: hypothetical protein WC959_04365 [Kiritimatiellales bacterium]